VSVVLGSLAGLVIAVLFVLAEHSRIAVNSYALFGNGALIVPALLAPYALYPGWSWLLRRGGRAVELAFFVFGLHFGIGTISFLEAIFHPTDSAISLSDALPGFIFSGSAFVLPAALLAGVALWVGSRVRGSALILAGIVGVVASAFLAIAYGAGLGILSGGAVALAQRDRDLTVPIGVALLVLIIVVGNLPFASALMSPR
jgi:hypothetical protein